MDFINSNTGWLTASNAASIGGHGVFYDNQIKKTTNGGLNWSVVYYSSNSLQYIKFKFFDDNMGLTWVDSKIYKTNDGGSNWILYSQLPNSSFVRLFMFNSNTGWMSGRYGDFAICKTTNGGLNWFLQFSDPIKYANTVFIKDENNAWASCSNNGIYKTTNGGGIISTINHISSNIPNGFSLMQNYPNPFNPTTKINFDLKNSAFAMLRVYDITGREVMTLVNQKLTAGSYTYDFNASELPSGVYFYQLRTEGFIETKKMMLLK